MNIRYKRIYEFMGLEFTIESNEIDDYSKLRISGGYIVDAPRDVIGDDVSEIRNYIRDIMNACDNALKDIDGSLANDR